MDHVKNNFSAVSVHVPQKLPVLVASFVMLLMSWLPKFCCEAYGEVKKDRNEHKLPLFHSLRDSEETHGKLDNENAVDEYQTPLPRSKLLISLTLPRPDSVRSWAQFVT
jgi:hypothetical protein